MLDRLDRLATGRRVLTALAVLAVLVVGVNVVATRFADAHGGGLIDLSGGRNALRLRAGLTPAEAYDLVAGYGATGRRDHLLITLLGDVALPLAAFGFAVLALWHALRRLGVARRWRRVALLLPVAYLAADYGENAGIVTLLLTFPTRHDGLAAATVTVTAVKSALIGLTLLAVVVAYVAVAAVSARGGTRQPSPATRRPDLPA